MSTTARLNTNSTYELAHVAFHMTARHPLVPRCLRRIKEGTMCEAHLYVFESDALAVAGPSRPHGLSGAPAACIGSCRLEDEPESLLVGPGGPDPRSRSSNHQAPDRARPRRCRPVTLTRSMPLLPLLFLSLSPSFPSLPLLGCEWR